MSLSQPTIIRSHRRTIALHITPDGKVIVKAPFFAPISYIQQFINEKKDWISERINVVEKHSMQGKRTYVHGEEYMFLGNMYVLDIGNYQEIAVRDKLYFPQALLFRIEKELTSWFIRQAKEKITQRVIYHATKMNAAYRGLTFSDTKSQWGSCTADNALQFNWRLIMAPLPVIDYVVIHELAHTQEKNHSADFWSKVRLHTPAYRQHRKWLKEHQGRLVI